MEDGDKEHQRTVPGSDRVIVQHLAYLKAAMKQGAAEITEIVQEARAFARVGGKQFPLLSAPSTFGQRN